jgi:hypothetical protein
MTIAYKIRYRRPEAPSSIAVMGVNGAAEAIAQMDRLRALGYTIHDLTPPLPVSEPDAA